MYQKLKAVVDESGIWTTPNHSFLLSPDVYRITEAQRDELTKLGYAIYDCLLGLSHIAVIAFDRNLNYKDAWWLARQVFTSGVPSVYHALQGQNVKHLPWLLKVDLMVDRGGNFRIAEIDGHNKHGLGYSTLARRFRNVLYPEATTLPGTVKMLAEEMKRLGHEELMLLRGDNELFYVPEFKIACSELERHGVECHLVAEREVNESMLEAGLFLDLPFLYRRPQLYNTIVPAYLSGAVSFVIPPKPFLGAKTVLAFLRNDSGNPQLEALLQTFIRGRSLELVRKYIPETYLVGSVTGNGQVATTRISGKRFVLKESISSGMKGTHFCDDPDFDQVLAKAAKTRLNWILQEEVVNQPQTFSWYGSDAKLNTSNDWFMRVAVQYVNRQLGDVIITACRSKAVHGGTGCLQLGAIVH